jgi:predicted metalloprotease with PDZ domain
MRRSEAYTLGIELVVTALLASSISGWSFEIPPKTLASLGSREFREREIAQVELLGWSRRQPEASMTELLRQSRKAEDPEVRQRCLNVLHELVIDEYSREGEGFIGIALKDEISNVPGDPKPRRVIRVTEVRLDAPARQAGIQLNDLIVGLNDQVWHDEDASPPFREKIRAMKPDTKVVLEVLRDGELIDCKVTLARRPVLADRPFFNGQNFDPEASEQAAKDAYFRRWLNQRKLPK